jgi:hypothetical protein
MRPERMWTYEEIAEALRVSKNTAKNYVARYRIRTYRKHQDNRRYIPQSSVMRLMRIYWVQTPLVKPPAWAKGQWKQRNYDQEPARA